MKQKIEWIIIIIAWLALLIVAIFFLPEWWNWDKIIDYLWNEPWENILNSWQLITYDNPILEQWPYYVSLAVIGIGLFLLNYLKLYKCNNRILQVLSHIFLQDYINLQT